MFAQLDMLTEAVDVASENPARFNLTVEEIGSRRKWLETTRRQVWGGRRGRCEGHVALA